MPRPFYILLAILALGAPQARAQRTEIARGIVYHDRNGNGRRDPGEPGLRDVRVSNQRVIVRTDRSGRYELPVTENTVLFVIKPKNWATVVDADGVARGYYIHNPRGTNKLRYGGVPPTGPLPASIDFALRPNRESRRFRFLLFGDTQPRDQKEIDYIAHDIVDQLIGFPAAFGVTLGDIVFNDLSLFPSLKRTLGAIGLPWFYVLGNHDTDQDVKGDELSTETFRRHFGPAYYSFDYGEVHFVVLDNILWKGPGYSGGLGPEQMEWLTNDLALVPPKQPVFLFMHIPLESTAERDRILALLQGRRTTFSASAHTHTQSHRFIGEAQGWHGSEPHHHLISGTVCGSWWSGAPDERGIPHATMSDGAPNGYSVVNVDGSRYTIDYYAASRPSSYQMSIAAPEEIEARASASADVQANIFAGSSRSTVQMRVGDGPWTPMEPVVTQDRTYMSLKELETSSTPPPGRRLPNASKSTHLWAARLPALGPGLHTITVRTTDMFGRTFEGHRVLRVR